jgi:hypothetical protein
MVGRSNVAKEIDKTAGDGDFAAASQPKASVHGTAMWLILTLPDSVSRRPMLFQLCANSNPGCAVGTIANMWLVVPASTPSSTVRSEITPPVLKCLNPWKTSWSPFSSITRSLSRGLTAPATLRSDSHIPDQNISAALTSDEIVVLDNQFLEPISLFICADDIRCFRPE